MTGSYARDVRICVYDGKMHPVDSNEISFMLAGRNAFSTSFKEAGPKTLGSLFTDVEVSVPADYLGDCDDVTCKDVPWLELSGD